MIAIVSLRNIEQPERLTHVEKIAPSFHGDEINITRVEGGKVAIQTFDADNIEQIVLTMDGTRRTL